MLQFLFFHDSVSQRSISKSRSVLIHKMSYFRILEVLDFLDFYFDLEVLFVIEMGL